MADEQSSRFKNLSLASITALTGCVPLVVIFLALFIGLWIDATIGQRGPGIICSLAVSLPVSLFLMTRLALYLVARIRLPMPPNDAEPDAENANTTMR
jgi:hypothetical protein